MKSEIVWWNTYRTKLPTNIFFLPSSKCRQINLKLQKKCNLKVIIYFFIHLYHTCTERKTSNNICQNTQHNKSRQKKNVNKFLHFIKLQNEISKKHCVSIIKSKGKHKKVYSKTNIPTRHIDNEWNHPKLKVFNLQNFHYEIFLQEQTHKLNTKTSTCET